MKIFLVSILLLGAHWTVAQQSRVQTLNEKKGLNSDRAVINTLAELHYEDNSMPDPEEKSEKDSSSIISFDRTAYSQDSLIRLYRYYWEDCGLYCFESDVLLLAYQDSDDKALQFLDLVKGSVDSILKMEEGKYLVFNNHWSRSRGGGSDSHRSANLLSVGDSLELIWSLEIYTSDQDEEAILELDYNPKTKKLSYRYKFREYQSPWRDYINKGVWVYANGNFKLQEEETEYLKN